MARIYGERWKTVEQIDSGGQSKVFRVIDLCDPSGKPAALKWVQNPKRHARFENEVLAIKRLNHPNIIKLLDHSALDNVEGSDARQFLVMPEALGGNLSKRATAMKGSLDTSLIVASQIAAALTAAHAAQVIHRDVKPQNVLFVGDGNDIWLADFGICLIAERERPTESGEVPGPWAFMAPELELGGKLDVTPAADVYSLGKLIFYMLSGGIVLPRERLDDERYQTAFSQGGRYNTLRILLSRMITLLPNRIPDMATVAGEIDRLMHWDQTAVQSPFRPETRSKLEALKVGILEKQRLANEREAAAAALRDARELVTREVTDWLLAETHLAATDFNDGMAMQAQVHNLAKRLPALQGSPFQAFNGVGLSVQIVGSNIEHHLMMLLCTRLRAMSPTGENPIYILPVYFARQRGVNAAGNSPERYYYIKMDGFLMHLNANPTRGNAHRPQLRNQFPPQPTTQPQGVNVHALELVPSNWPQAEPDLKTFSSTVFNVLVQIIERNYDKIIPT